MQDSHKDSTICYNQEELRAIALNLIENRECDALLIVANKQLDFADTIITSQKDIIAKQKIQVTLAANVINKQNQDIKDLTKDVHTSKVKLKWVKIGWVSTSVAIISLWIYTLMH
jgi:hypothetical protein